MKIGNVHQSVLGMSIRTYARKKVIKKNLLALLELKKKKKAGVFCYTKASRQITLKLLTSSI